MIIDCITFHNDYDMLEGRLKYLYDTVDLFIIVEANRTFSGLKKPLNYFNNRMRYKQYWDKILYHPVWFNESDGVWYVENEQRNKHTEILRFFDPEAYVMISDLDEIPLKRSIKEAIIELDKHNFVAAFQHDIFWYNFDCCHPNKNYCGTLITKNKTFESMTPQQLRDDREKWYRFYNAGYHLSYWFEPEKIIDKIKSYAHQEVNVPEFTDINWIKDRIARKLVWYSDESFYSPTTLIDPEIFKIFNYTKTGPFGH